jgi:protease YdgD
VLTAAHCLYNRRTGAMLGAGSLHVLFGYRMTEYRSHLRVESYAVGPGYDGARPAESLTADWARLELAAPAPAAIRPLGRAAELPPAGGLVALAGYNQDRLQILMADTACHVTAIVTVGGRALIAHDCTATRGTSGGPLLARAGDGWRVVGLNVAAAAAGNLALPVADLP